MARRLVPLGAGPGSTVALVAHPNPLSVQAVWAVPRAGAVLAPLNPRLGAASLERALDVIGPDLILSTRLDVGDTALDADWVTALDDLPRPPGGEGAEDDRGPSGLADSASEPGATPEPVPRPFALLWTSGTSGDASVVSILSSALEASARASAASLGLTEADRWYASLSLGHIGGLALVHRAAHVGCRLLVRGRFSPEVLGELIDRDRLTHASVVPTMLRRLLDVRGGDSVPSTLRCLLVGGAAAGGTLVPEALQLGYPLALTYGLTEACSQVATAPPELVLEKPGTVGPPMDGLEVRILEDGEVCVRGETVSPGAADGEGWLATGDLGWLDGDGHLWISGRMNDRIVTGGTNVDPRSVETVLEGLPGVSSAAVAGVPHDVWGETVVALIVTDPGVEADPKMLIAQARDLLSASELPRHVEFAETLPVNVNGKIDREAVRAVFVGVSHA
jgi:O-succinylbenzoic acid--CoA ligase